VRFWNHVPFITDPRDARRDNYMVFNAGRFRAFADWLRRTARFERDVATASAIGHWGRDLIIHCLATDAPASPSTIRAGRAVSLQPAFRPLPPCFARATHCRRRAACCWSAAPRACAAKIRSPDDLASQLAETFLNLRCRALGRARQTRTSSRAAHARLLALSASFASIIPTARRQAIESGPVRIPLAARLEMLHADLCRAELLVEIEGFADLRAHSHEPSRRDHHRRGPAARLALLLARRDST
jgi:chorismate lyase/3-hydroxybenzoate synthase